MIYTGACGHRIRRRDLLQHDQYNSHSIGGCTGTGRHIALAELVVNSMMKRTYKHVYYVVTAVSNSSAHALVSVAAGSPVLLVQQLVDDNLYLVVVFPHEAGVEITVSKPHCHKPFHWAPWKRGSLPLTADPLGDVWAVHPLGCIL